MDLPTFIKFLAQVGLAVSGAACLWGYVFAKKSASGGRNKDKFWELSSALMFLFGGSFLLFIVAWWTSAVFLFTETSYGHEGIVHATDNFVRAGFVAGMPFVIAATLIGFAGIYLFKKKEEVFKKVAHNFFALQFVMLSLVLALMSYTNSLGKIQISYIMHNWHSIITLGTVVAVDFLFIYTLQKDGLKRILYPVYPIMSAFIWIGLGMDFVSSILFNGFDPMLNTQFIFNQMVVAIIIMNGALLSVYLNDSFISLIKKTRVSKPGEALEEIARISGSVSIISWLTITFLDSASLHHLDLNQFFAIYLGLIAAAYLAKPVAEKAAAKVFA